ncbi:MAG TPA: TetR/AcrR family transcriptional regulator [Isosphaeraceae bacterium]|nr:TetR/AcrR family transcriptional regulator [Isosphaeraceae bacterium]
MSPSELALPLRRTQAERRQETEQALLAAATRLFARIGIDNASLADIGEEAGYSRGLVNHRFGSKAAFVERLAGDSQTAFIDALDQSHPSGEIATLFQVIDTYLDRVSEESTASRSFFVMWGAALPSSSALRPIFMADDARFRNGIEAIIRTGQAKGRIESTVDAKSFAVAFVGLLRGVGAQYMIDPEAVDLAPCKTTIVGFVESVLTTSPPNPST